MALLTYTCATMGAGKSLDALRTAHSYEELGKKVLALTPKIDTRYGIGQITSRLGVQRSAIAFTDADNLYDLVSSHAKGLHLVVLDEAQFLSREQAFQLAKVVDILGVPVHCFGLKNTFQNRLFVGSEALLVLADKVKELETVCTCPDCGRFATMVIRYKDGVPTDKGETIQIGGNDSYKAVCRYHYYKILGGYDEDTTDIGVRNGTL